MEHLEKFKEWLRLHKDSQKTVNEYYNQMKLFFKTNKEFNQDNINNFLINQKEEKSISSFNLFLGASMAYAEFQNLKLQFPKFKKTESKARQYITQEKFEDEILPMVSLIFQEQYEKYEFLFQLMFYTGFRVKEIINLDPKDIDLENNTITVRARKNKKDLVVPIIFDRLGDLLKKYVGKMNEEDVFKWTRTQVVYAFRKIKEELNLDEFHPHLMRSSFAKNCFRKGVPSDVVQKLMGHSSIMTTKMYADHDTLSILTLIDKIKGDEKW